MIRLVTALAAEARPLVRHYRLRPSDGGPYPRFRGDDVEMVVSGVGSWASAAAVGYLAGSAPARHAGWVNFGIAGHRDATPGTVRLAHRVVRETDGRTWYPPAVFDPPCATGTVRTVVDVESEFADSDAVYEMEAGGFYPAAVRHATGEVVQVWKVVSDNASSPPDRLTAKRIESLVEDNLESLVRLIDSLGEVTAELAERPPATPDLQTFEERWRFSVTQRRQLARLLQRLAVVSAAPVLVDDVVHLRSAKDVLENLRRRL